MNCLIHENKICEDCKLYNKIKVNYIFVDIKTNNIIQENTYNCSNCNELKKTIIHNKYNDIYTKKENENNIYIYIKIYVNDYLISQQILDNRTLGEPLKMNDKKEIDLSSSNIIEEFIIKMTPTLSL